MSSLNRADLPSTAADQTRDTLPPATPPSPLYQLPGELRDCIFDFLDKKELQPLNLTATWCRDAASPRIWRDVELVDCRMTPTDSGPLRSTGVSNTTGIVARIPAGAFLETDEHDDTPLIRKLLVLAMNPSIAGQVRTLTHRCHLAPPAIFNELLHAPFSAQTLSVDPRTIRLLRMAVHHMTRVTELRIVFGHPRLTEALLRCFFDFHRERDLHVRKLWLENVRLNEGLEQEITNHKYGLPLSLDFSGLKSIRLRRVPLRTFEMSLQQRMTNRASYVYSRGRVAAERQNGFGGHYVTSVNTVGAEVIVGHEQLELFLDHAGRQSMSDPELDYAEKEEWPLERLLKYANQFDDQIYEDIAKQVKLPQEVIDAAVPSHRKRAILAYRECWPNGPEGEMVRRDPVVRESLATIFRDEVPLASQGAMGLFKQAAPTLTNLTLDWILISRPEPGPVDNFQSWLGWYHELFSLRFPNLRAFQHRNAVVKETQLPPYVYLLDYCPAPFTASQAAEWLLPTQQNMCIGLKPLEFMEAHPNLQCLAWPMDRFFATLKPPNSPNVALRAQKVIERLGRTLLDLRVDTLYSGHGEYQSEEGILTTSNAPYFAARNKFITHFAAHMESLISLKIEGGMPRDERRETIRALQRCPLEKIVLIGVCSPIGNTWGSNGEDFAEDLNPEEGEMLEAEDKTAIHALGPRPLVAPAADASFKLQHGWRGAAPMLHTLASYHSTTIRELKFCGYKGSAVLFDPTPITDPMLAPLRHCHNLESLILSFWLPASFENQAMDDEIIALWWNRRDRNTTALAVVSDEEPELGTWEWRLRTRFMPEALAWRITTYVGQYLSETAKRRPGGVHVRASFCLGDWGGIFDVDCWVAKGGLGSDVCLRFKGPREEMEQEKRQEKLEKRRWF